MRLTATILALAIACPLAAADYEKILLPVAPSIVYCGYESRYETRLLAYNASADRIERICADGTCRDLAPRASREFTGEYAGGLPLPLFLYVPRETAKNIGLSLMVESSERSRLEERSFTELPIIRERDFRDGKTEFINVRIDPGFRQTVRIFGIDPHASAALMMRVYELDTGLLIHECEHTVAPLSSETNSMGLPIRPSFGMECDMSEHLRQHSNTLRVRIELESLTPGFRYYSFMSVTNNETQHFYTVLPH